MLILEKMKHLSVPQLLILICLFGFQLQNLRAFAQELEGETANLDEATPIEMEAAGEEPPVDLEPVSDGWVEVEPSNIVPSELTGSFYLVPYRIRRKTWGLSVSASYSTFEPSSYTPDALQVAYSDVYNSAEIPLIELQMTVKYNMKLGALGFDIGIGSFKESSDTDLIESELSIMPIRFGASLIFDTLFIEPYLVPYISGGAYTVNFKESYNSVSVEGWTQAAPYVAAGLQFQLNWVDPISARESYVDAGIENTFLYLEGRKFFASTAAKDPDFETDMHVNGGLRVEF